MESGDRPVLRSRAWPVALALLVVLLGVLMTAGTSPPIAAAAAICATLGCAVTVVAVALLRTRRQRRRYEDELTSWAAERATQAERLRIARDLHDLASHGLGLITVRAAAARALTGPAGEAERAAALADIEHAGREATTELRRMLAVLRTPGDETPLSPVGSLDALPQLVDAARTAGVIAQLSVGELGAISGGTQVTVCAVVREALANTARHAGPTRAHITVGREGDQIVTRITDDGPVADWSPHPGAGVGLAHLRERVAALGGTLRSGSAGTGYELCVRIPEALRR
ncbi:sensor histidine kinase [Kribbella sp. NPDC048928]|uniref:sensor histidine kinase n=1 Tax=Kribbella sp. NPDC048928 TaxID=3364111 RepID=UPI003715B963